MERKLKPIYVQQALQTKGIRLFSPPEFQRVSGVSLRAAQEFVNHCDDLFLKIRNGLYTLRADQSQEEVIANRLYPPSYISFEYALNRYGIIPEIVYAVTSATTRITREFVVNIGVSTLNMLHANLLRLFQGRRVSDYFSRPVFTG